MRGDVLEYVAQESPQFDAEIGQKDHFRMEASYIKPPTIHRGIKRISEGRELSWQKFSLSTMKNI